MNQKLLSLFTNKNVQKIIIEALKKEDLVTQDSVHFTDMAYTKKGKEIIKNPIKVNMQFINDYNKIFPEEWRKSPGVVKEYYIRYNALHPDHTENEILTAAKLWVETKENFCGYSHYFFEKSDSNNIKDSRCESYVLNLRNNKKNTFKSIERIE